MSDTPRMESVAGYASGIVDAAILDEGMKIERELNAANDRIKRLEAVVNDPEALWTNWLRGTVKLPSGIGDVRQYQERIKRLEEAVDTAIRYCEFYGPVGATPDTTKLLLKELRKAKEVKP